MSNETARPMHQSADHYGGLRVALVDVDRLALDLQHMAEAQVVIPTGELLFLTRRLRQLTRASLAALPPGEA